MDGHSLEQCASMEVERPEFGPPRPLDFPPGSFLQSVSGKFLLIFLAASNSAFHTAAKILSVDTIFLSATEEKPIIDLLDDEDYEQFLRLAWGGWLGALWMAPLPTLDLSASAAAETSQRRRALMAAAHTRGAAICWDATPADLQDVCNTDMLRAWNAGCCNVAACAWGVPAALDWWFCSNSIDVMALASKCSCAGGHQAAAPRSQHPAQLALELVRLLSHSCSCNGQLIASHALPLSRPVLSLDGAGIHSTADWSSTTKPDPFLELRERLWRLAQESEVDKVIFQHMQQRHDSVPLSPKQLAPFLQVADHWLREQDFEAWWQVPVGQSFRLHILECLVQITHDHDKALLPSLLAGVSTGVYQPLLPSGLWPRKASEEHSDEPLLVCQSNWQGAEEEPHVTQALIDSEIANGWVQEVPGGLEAARRKWRRIAVGKLNVVNVPNKAPRLILDSSSCGVNHNCILPESMILPSVDDVRRATSSNSNMGEYSALVLDIHAAHKQIRIHPEEQGLVLFQFNQRTYHYTVAHFGARFSAWWWQRLGAMLLRIMHNFLHVQHRGWIYVDDILILLHRSSFSKQVTLSVLFLLLINTPISWKKAQVGDQVTWTGWDFNFNMDTVQLTQPNVVKLLQALDELLAHKQAKAKTLEVALGMLIWFTSVARYLRPHLAELYRCLHSRPAALYSVPAQFWADFLSVLNDEAVVAAVSPSLSLPIGGRVVEYSHLPVRAKSDLPITPFKSHLQWVRVQDLRATAITLTKDAVSYLQWFRSLLRRSQHVFSIHMPTLFVSKAAADAYAQDQRFGIGGWIITPRSIVWFSEEFSMAQLKAFLPNLTKDAQKYICAFEILAQVGLVMAALRAAKLQHVAVTLPAASDNTAAEAGVNKLLSTRWPASVFLQMLGDFAFQHHVHLAVSHIPGPRNDWADDLSRQRTQRWLHYPRFRLSLQDFFDIGRNIRLFPPHDWPQYMFHLQKKSCDASSLFVFCSLRGSGFLLSHALTCFFCRFELSLFATVWIPTSFNDSAH